MNKNNIHLNMFMNKRRTEIDKCWWAFVSAQGLVFR